MQKNNNLNIDTLIEFKEYLESSTELYKLDLKDLFSSYSYDQKLLYYLHLISNYDSENNLCFSNYSPEFVLKNINVLNQKELVNSILYLVRAERVNSGSIGICISNKYIKKVLERLIQIW